MLYRLSERWARVELWAAALLALAVTLLILLNVVTRYLGAALFWPFDNARIFAPETPVRVSPIGRAFFSERGIATLLSELRWIWLPCFTLALIGWGARRAARPGA